MMKVPENSSAARLNKLLSRNLGTDLETINGKSKSSDKAAAAEKALFNQPEQPSIVKHQQLSDKTGLMPGGLYDKKPSNINQRAQKRKQLNDARKQANVEAIMTLAMEYCSESTSTEDIDPDWFHQFIQLSEDTSSKMMQALWGKILAGEIARPGTFSFKSLTILKRMTNKEALAFQHACQLAMTNRRDNSAQIIYGYYQKPGLINFLSLGKKGHINLSKLNLPYPELLMLMDTELIYHSEIESGELSGGESIEYNYLGRNIQFTARKNGTVLNYFKFTQTGCELARLIRLNPDQTYLDELTQVFSSTFEISS